MVTTVEEIILPKPASNYNHVTFDGTGLPEVIANSRDNVNAAEKRKRGSGSASATDVGPSRKQQWYLTYSTGMSTNPCLSTSILGREPRHITSPPSPPKLSQQHHNRDTAIMRRVKPCRDDNVRKKSIRLAKQDFLNGTENSIRSASRTYNIPCTKLNDRLREQQLHSDAHRRLQLLSIRAMKAKVCFCEILDD